MGTALSLLVLATLSLLLGAVFLWRRGGARRQAVLMLVLAFILGINIAIWTVPGADGAAPVSARPRP